MNAHAYPMQGVFDDPPIPQPATSSAQYWGQRFLAVNGLIWAASFVVGFQTALMLLTLVGFAAAVLGIRRPVLGLMGIAVLVTVDGPAKDLLFTGGLLRYNMFNYWLLIVMMLSIPFLLRLRDPQARLLQAFVLLLGLQLVATPSPVGGVLSILSIVTLFGLLVYFAAASHDRQIFYWVGLVCGVVSGVGGLVFFLQLGQLSIVNPNAWAFFPLTGLFAICLGFPFAVEKSRGRLTLGVLAVLNLAVVNLTWIFLSASRGVLSIAVICLAYLTMSIQGIPRRLAFLIFAGILAFSVSFQFPEFQDRVVGRVRQLFDPTLEITTRSSGRSDLMLGGWHIFKNNPFGVGTGGFRSAWANLGDLGGVLGFARRTGLETPAHSGWIKVLAENGIIGFLLLAAYVASFAIVGLQKSRQSRDLLLLGTMVSAVLAVAFVAREFQDKGLWFLAAGATTLLHGLDLGVRPRAGAYPGIPGRPDVGRLLPRT